MKTLRRNNIKSIAEVLSKIPEKRRTIVVEKNNPVDEMKIYDILLISYRKRIEEKVQRNPIISDLGPLHI